jgi:hypothetical protein
MVGAVVRTPKLDSSGIQLVGNQFRIDFVKRHWNIKTRGSIQPRSIQGFSNPPRPTICRHPLPSPIIPGTIIPASRWPSVVGCRSSVAHASKSAPHPSPKRLGSFYFRIDCPPPSRLPSFLFLITCIPRFRAHLNRLQLLQIGPCEGESPFPNAPATIDSSKQHAIIAVRLLFLCLIPVSLP